MRLNRRVPVGTHGGVRGRLSIYESLLLDYGGILSFSRVTEMPLKTKNAYRTLPLSADAINVLKIQKCKVGNSEWVFPSPTGGPMSPDSVLHILNADILDMLASTLMDDFASTSFAIVIHGITPLFFLMALFYRRRCPI